MKLKKSATFRQSFPSLVLAVLILFFWQKIVDAFHVPLWLLPSPAKIVAALWSTRSLLWGHTWTTILETTSGFLLAIVLGVATAVAMALFPRLKRLLYPYLIISQTVPLIAVAPLLIVWLGYGLLPKIATVVLVCFFPIAVSLLEGLELAENDLLNLLRSMGASHWQIFTIVRWPQAMPSFFAGLKIAATYSVMGAVIGEWLGASSGLGVYLTRSSHSFLTDRVFAAILTITILSLLYFFLISLLARITLSWAYSKHNEK